MNYLLETTIPLVIVKCYKYWTNFKIKNMTTSKVYSLILAIVTEYLVLHPGKYTNPNLESHSVK